MMRSQEDFLVLFSEKDELCDPRMNWCELILKMAVPLSRHQSEFDPFWWSVVGLGQPGDVVSLEAAVERASAEVGDGVFQRAHDIASGSGVLRRNSTMMASSAEVSTVLVGFFGPMGASAVVARLRHFRTVLG